MPGALCVRGGILPPGAERFASLAEHGDNAVEDGYSDDEDADKGLVCVLHNEYFNFQRRYAVGRRPRAITIDF